MQDHQQLRSNVIVAVAPALACTVALAVAVNGSSSSSSNSKNISRSSSNFYRLVKQEALFVLLRWKSFTNRVQFPFPWIQQWRHHMDSVVCGRCPDSIIRIDAIEGFESTYLSVQDVFHFTVNWRRPVLCETRNAQIWQDRTMTNWRKTKLGKSIE